MAQRHYHVELIVTNVKAPDRTAVVRMVAQEMMELITLTPWLTTLLTGMMSITVFATASASMVVMDP